VRTLYAVVSWALLGLGVLHVIASASRFTSVSADALWFTSAGVLMVLVAAVNLLNRAYGDAAPGLRRVCIAANFVNLGLATAGGVVTHARFVQWLIVLAILVPLTLIPLLSVAQRQERTGFGAAHPVKRPDR